MNKELEILKKHLGEVQSQNEFNAKLICTQISDANDFVGALQILDLNLKKIQKNLEERKDEKLSEEQKRSIDASNAQMIHSCAFMGTSLFNHSFKLNMAQKNFNFEIQNPLFVLEKGGYEGVLAYIEDKREEIQALLLDLATAISLGTAENAFKASEDIKLDYTKLF